MTPDLAALIIPSFAILFLGTTVYFHDRKSRTNLLFFLISISALLWSIANYYSVSVPPEESAVWVRLTLLFTALFIVLLFLFVLNFPYRNYAVNRYLTGVVLLLLGTAMTLALTPSVLTDISVSGHVLSPIPGTLLAPIYSVIVLLALCATLLTMVRRYLSHAGKERREWGMMLSGAAATYLFFGAGSYLFVIVFRDTALNAYGPICLLPLFFGIGLVLLHQSGLNIKLIASKILVFSILVLSLGDILFARDIPQIIFHVFIFAFLCIFSVVLIKSVMGESRQKAEAEKLTKDLKKANKRLKMLDTMKSEFVSVASHQLRGPLTSIRGYTSMLLEGSYGKLSKKTAEAVERIDASSRFMALSIEDYLSVSRIESGHMQYDKADFDLKETVEKIVDEVRSAALKKGLVLIFRSNCTGSCRVFADARKIRQIVLNLLDNAMKYTEKGKIHVIVHDDMKKKKIYISVKDSGVGMSNKTQEELFNKFIRARNANAINVTGTGLGLFVAKKMITEMDGEISAESDGEGKGSIFHVELPSLPGKKRR